VTNEKANPPRGGGAKLGASEKRQPSYRNRKERVVRRFFVFVLVAALIAAMGASVAQAKGKPAPKAAGADGCLQLQRDRGFGG